MKYQKLLSAVFISGILFGCSDNTSKSEENTQTKPIQKTDVHKDQSTLNNENLLLADWTGPYQGVPAFDKVKVSDLKPAIKYGYF